MNCKQTCTVDILCDFEQFDNQVDALVEICKNCGKIAVYPRINGDINQEAYLEDHKRMTLQPHEDPGLFHGLYGDVGIKMGERYKQQLIQKQKRKELREELDDKRISMRKRALRGSGMSEKEITQTLPKHIRTTGKQI